MPKPKKPTKRDLAEFQKRAEQILIEASAKRTPGSIYNWNIDTKAGPWGITIYDDWIATRFEDVDKAVKLLSKLDLNPHTGKMNFHYTSTASAAAADDFGKQLQYVLAKVNPARSADHNKRVFWLLAFEGDPSMGSYEGGVELAKGKKSIEQIAEIALSHSVKWYDSTSGGHIVGSVKDGWLELNVETVSNVERNELIRRLQTGMPRRNPAPAGVKPLQHKFDPDRLPPGAYETSSQSAGYPAARFLVESGKARILSEQFLPGGHVLLTYETGKRNPEVEVEGERTVAVKMTRKWLESRTREYRDWRTAWWREAIQNSIDPGTGAATHVDLRCEPGPDGNWIVSCDDNGRGMTQDQVEDEEKGFLSFGGSGKGSGSSIGGFGEAKQLLIFPWIQYRLVTSDQEYIGKGNVAKAKKVDPRKGVLLEVIMPADFHTTPEDAEAVLSKSWIPNVTFTLNGKPVKFSAPTPDKVLDEAEDEGIVYEADRRRKSAATIAKEQEALPGEKIDKREPADILVRKDGLWMFSEELSASAKHGLICEVTGKSTKIFTTNRDGFSWQAGKLRKILDRARNEFASEGKMKSRKEKPMELVVRGTGRFSAHSEMPRRAMEMREAIGSLPTSKTPSKGIQLGTDVINDLVSKISAFTDEDVQRFRESRPSEGEIDPESSASLMQAIMSSPEASRVILQSVDFRGQKSIDAAVKQMVWQPDFYLLKDEGLKYTVPPKFMPEKMTPAVLRLLKTWAELCRFILVSIGSELDYGVGLWFSEDAAAGYLYRKNEHWLLLDPNKDRYSRKEIFNPADVSDLKRLWSLAQHEVAHMLVRAKYNSSDEDEEAPSPASHGQDYASSLTDLHEQLADAWSKVRKIAASIKLRGQIERPERSARAASEKKPIEEMVGATKLADDIGSFVKLWHEQAVDHSNATPYGAEQLGKAYLRMMASLKQGDGSKVSRTRSLQDAYRYTRAIFQHDQVYDSPVWIAVRPAVTLGEYIVSVSFNCFDIDSHVCNALKDQVRDARRLLEENRSAYPRLRGLDVVYDFEDGMEQWNPEPEERSPNPCPCKDKQKTSSKNLQDRYKNFAASAQKAAAQGKMKSAKQYKLQASRMLKQAQEAGEIWAMPSQNPVERPSYLRVLPGGRKGSGGRIAVKQIDLIFAEGPSDLSGMKQQIVAEAGVSVWNKADQVLGEWARKIIPDWSRGSWKQDYVITWEDGEKFFGTYPLSKKDQARGNLARDLAEFVLFYSGTKPEDMSMVSFKEFLIRSPDAVRNAKRILEGYDMGSFTPRMQTKSVSLKLPVHRGGKT